MSNEKSTNRFKEVIQNHLNQLAENDSLFAVTLAKENKSIDGCINYILNTVQKSGISGFDDSEIFEMAVHYYDEDSIEGGKLTNCHVVINHQVKLTEEEIQEARQQAKAEVIQKETNRLTQKIPAKTVTSSTSQTSLF